MTVADFARMQFRLGFSTNEIFGALNGDATVIAGGNFNTNETTFAITIGANNNSGTFKGTIWLADVENPFAYTNIPLSITKLGTGTQTFNGNCSNTAPTFVGGGSLVINANYASSAITDSNLAIFGGNGTLANLPAVKPGQPHSASKTQRVCVANNSCGIRVLLPN